MKPLLTISFFLISVCCLAQSDSLNRVDEAGHKQGVWVIYGYIKPELGYCDSCVIESGNYHNDRRNGAWIKYDKDGKITRTIVYKFGRPLLIGLSTDTSKVLIDFMSDDNSSKTDLFLDEMPADSISDRKNEKDFYLFHIDYDGILIGSYVEGGRMMDDKLRKYDSEGVLIWFEIWKVKQRKVPIDW